MAVEPARTVGAVDVEPTVSWGTFTVPQDSLWGVIAGIGVAALLTWTIPVLALKLLGPLVGMLQMAISLWRNERVGGWKLVLAKVLAGRLPNKVEGRSRYRERMHVLEDDTRKIVWSRPKREDPRLAVPPGVEVVTDGLIKSLDRGHMVVLRYEPPGEHWGSDAHERWARRFMTSLREIGGSAQLWTRIRRMDGDTLRAQQAQAIAMAVGRIGTPVPADVVEAELRHAERLAQDVHVVEHFLVLHPSKEGLWTSRWQMPSKASIEDAEGLLTQALLDVGGAIRARRATVAEIREAVAWGINGGQVAYADYRTGVVSMPDGERRMVALSRPPRDLFPGKLIEACLNLTAETVVLTTRLAMVPEFEAAEKLRKVARDYESSLRSSGKAGAEERAAVAAIEDAHEMSEQIYQERASSWRWQTLIEFSSPPSEGATALRGLVAELQEARWKPQVLRLWPLHAHAAMALGGGALRRFELLMPEKAAAYALPVLGMPFSDSEAPIFGRNELTGTPVFLDISKEYGGIGTQTNRNMSLIGPPGSGKTTTLGQLLAGVASRGGGLTVLDYHSEMAALITAYGGSYIELADSALNPFAGVLPGMGSEQRELLRETISILAADYLKDDRRGLRAEEESWLTEALSWFVTEWLGEQHPQPPLLSQFLARLEQERTRDGSELPVIDRRMATNLLLRLRTWTQGLKGRTFDRHSTLDLSGNRLICLGMRKLRESLSTENLYGPIAIVLSAFHRELTKHGPNQGWIAGRGHTMHLVVDEAHLAFDDPTLGPALTRFSRETRKYGGGVLAASQNLDDWLGGSHSRRFLENAGTRLFLGVTQQTREPIQQITRLEDWELDFLVERNDRGFGVLIAGQEQVIAQVTPHDLIIRKLQEVMSD